MKKHKPDPRLKELGYAKFSVIKQKEVREKLREMSAEAWRKLPPPAMGTIEPVKGGRVYTPQQQQAFGIDEYGFKTDGKPMEDVMSGKPSIAKATKHHAGPKHTAPPKPTVTKEKKQDVRAGKRAELQLKKIHLLVKENPKREGTTGWKHFSLYKNGMTVAEFCAAGGTIPDVRWDEKHKFIELR